MISTYTDKKYEVMNEHHTLHSAHRGVEITINNIKLYQLDMCEDRSILNYLTTGRSWI